MEWAWAWTGAHCHEPTRCKAHIAFVAAGLPRWVYVCPVKADQVVAPDLNPFGFRVIHLLLDFGEVLVKANTRGEANGAVART